MKETMKAKRQRNGKREKERRKGEAKKDRWKQKKQTAGEIVHGTLQLWCVTFTLSN